MSRFSRVSLSEAKNDTIRQPSEKDGDTMTSFVMESFANVDGRGFREQRYTARSWRKLLQGPIVEIDNKIPWVYY